MTLHKWNRPEALLLDLGYYCVPGGTLDEPSHDIYAYRGRPQTIEGYGAPVMRLPHPPSVVTIRWLAATGQLPRRRLE